MKNQWLQKNVDLSILANRITLFFNEKGFETDVEKVEEGYLIEAVSKIPKLKLAIRVVILGRPNDFVVEFSAGSGGYFSPSIVAGYLTSFLGGGYLLSREARKQDVLYLIERDFWRHTQMQVADLVDSTSREGSE